MNERIRKLAKKSGATINEGFDGNKNFVYGITMSPEELEKFAELIVRECIDVIDETHGSKKLLRPDPYQQIVSNIQEHFGVE